MHETSSEIMQGMLDEQRAACLTEGTVSAATRIDRLARAIDLLQRNGHRLCQAMDEDFGNRSLQQSKITDIGAAITPLKHARRNVRRWMRPERRSTFPFSMLGGRGRVEYQPLGVVGCISPWNFPVQLTFAPLAGILAAGNRTMLKPSEYTPITSELIRELLAQTFGQDEVAVVTGGTEVGSQFSALPFDHLLFTGATSVARHVMRAAAENLVPVTLELGGKSPVVIGRSADLHLAAQNIMAGKTMNAGQICLAPDYVLVPEESANDFVGAARASVAAMYRNLKDNPDYTSVISKRHFDRLSGYLDDARSKGAEVIEINPADEDFAQQEHYRIPPTLVLDPTDEMRVMEDEIFGPILPVKRYRDVTEALEYIKHRDRPLGLYYFGNDATEERLVLDNTISGGVTINDVIMHIAQEELPFGGIGPSGMGAYHGRDGFRTFSHTRSIYRQPKLISMLAAKVRPPYGK